MELSQRIKDVLIDDAKNMTEKGHRMMTAYFLLELAQKLEAKTQPTGE